MTILITVLVLFFLAISFHIMIWKIHIPYRQTRALLLIFFGILTSGVIFLWWFPPLLAKYGLLAPANIYEYMHIVLFFTSLTLAYITTYSGIEVDSPSLVMTMIIEKAGSKGIPKEDFEKALTDDILVKPRVRDLVRDKLAYARDSKYIISPKGIRLARIFLFYRRLLNLKEEGG